MTISPPSLPVQRPSNLSRERAVTYGVASALVNDGRLPELSYRQAVKALGRRGAAELSYLLPGRDAMR